MQKTLLFILVLAFARCGIEEEKAEAAPDSSQAYGLQTVVIDSCEYLIKNWNGNSGLMSHKGNCAYCKKRK